MQECCFLYPLHSLSWWHSSRAKCLLLLPPSICQPTRKIRNAADLPARSISFQREEVQCCRYAPASVRIDPAIAHTKCPDCLHTWKFSLAATVCYIAVLVSKNHTAVQNMAYHQWIFDIQGTILATTLHRYIRSNVQLSAFPQEKAPCPLLPALSWVALPSSPLLHGSGRRFAEFDRVLHRYGHPHKQGLPSLWICLFHSERIRCHPPKEWS